MIQSTHSTKFYAPGEHAIINALCTAPPKTLPELAAATGLTPFYVSSFLRRMKDENLLATRRAATAYQLHPDVQPADLLSAASTSSPHLAHVADLSPVFDTYLVIDLTLPVEQWMNAEQMLRCIPAFAAHAAHPVSRRTVGRFMRRRGVAGRTTYAVQPKMWPVRPVAA